MALHKTLGFPIILQRQEARKFEQSSEISSKIEDIRRGQLEKLDWSMCYVPLGGVSKKFISVVSLGSELPAHLSYGRGCYVPLGFHAAGFKTDL